jgi:ABC-type Fe3+ transport system substrate-binding protein
MKSLFNAVFTLLLFVLLSACTIDKARPSKKQHLTIASDCLTTKDEKLFRNFEKTSKINIHILYITPDSLQKLLQKEGLTTQIDCVISSSVYDMEVLSDSKFLQEKSIDLEKGIIPSEFVSTQKDFVGFGFDPYILLAENDSSKHWRNYSDLTGKLSFTTDLNTTSELLPFYSIVSAKFAKSKPTMVYKWFKNFRTNALIATNDSLQPKGTNVFFTLYSHYEKQKKIVKKLNFIFPNQQMAGLYYSMPCFGIIKQARNYSNARVFLNYFLQENVNKYITNRLKVFPVITKSKSTYPYQNQSYKKTTVSPIHQTKQYPRVVSFVKKK